MEKQQYQDNISFQQPMYHHPQIINQQGQHPQQQQSNQFWKNPDPDKKNTYLILSRIPFYLLLGIIIYVYTNYMMTLVLPQIIGLYDLESYEEQYISLTQIDQGQLTKHKTTIFQNTIHQSLDYLQFKQNAITNFMAEQLENYSSQQVQGFQNFLILHFFGLFFGWSLYKTITVKPGDIPANYKKNELEEYYIQEELFIQQLKDNLRQKTMRATQTQNNQMRNQQKNQENIFTTNDNQNLQQNNENQNQGQAFPNPNFDKQSDNENQKNNESFKQQDRSDSEVCYDEEDENDQLNQQTMNHPFIGGSSTYEEERDILNRIKFMHQQNTFKNANLRFCKKCNMFKPDRTHHCSQCRKCVLRMDHHCQWVDNCLGFYNYKYFITMLFFATILLIFITSTYISCYMDATITESISVFRLFTISLMFYFTTILMIIITCFTLLHFWLVCNGKTTIEWCEKKKDSITRKYDIGCCGNITTFLNYNPLFWCCPFNLNLEGDGLQFKIREDYQF